MQISEETKSTIYLLPLIANNQFTISQFDPIDSTFVNAYNQDINAPYLQENIFLLFKYSLDDYYVKTHKLLEPAEGYITDSMYTIDGKDYLVYKFNIPADFIEDYKHIVNGNYKYLSDKCKQTIVNFWENKREFLYSAFKQTNNIELQDIIGENAYHPYDYLEELLPQ